jgi:hypothetical protein
MANPKMLDHLASIAANLENFDGVFVLTYIRSEEDDSISFMANGDSISYVESVGLGHMFCRFIELDAVTKRLDEEGDDDEDRP